MKQNEESRLIPVIILTTTNDPREIKRCYELGYNIYVTNWPHHLLFAAIGSFPNYKPSWTKWITSLLKSRPRNYLTF